MRKILITAGITISSIVIFIALPLILISIRLESDFHEEIVLSTPSPDNVFTLTINKTDGGATTSVSHTVYLTRNPVNSEQAEIAWFYGAHIDGDYGIKASWIGEREINVEYSSTKNYRINDNMLDSLGIKLSHGKKNTPAKQ